MKNLISKVCSSLLTVMLVLSGLVFSVNAAEKSITGTQKVFIIAEDWGPVVKKTVIQLNSTIQNESIGDEDNEFAVVETKQALNAYWEETTATTQRTILDVYASDELGNEVSGNTSYITIDMYVSPTMTGEGAAFFYSPVTWYNQWCETYKLDIQLNGTLTSIDGDIITAIEVDNSIDLSNDNDRICGVINKFTSSEFKSSDGNTLPYASYSPIKDNKKNALVIWLHGAGEGGSNPEIAYLGNEVSSLISDEFQNKFKGAYVLVPQCPEGYGWPVDAEGNYTSGATPSKWRDSLFELIDTYVNNNSDIDTDRIIIGGCSNGGNMVYDIVLSHMGYFAAAFPMCHEYDIKVVTEEQLNYLMDFPVWSTYTLEDSSSFLGSIPIVEKMKEIGATNFHYSEFPDASDESGRYFGDPNDLYSLDTSGNSTTPLKYDGHWAWTKFFNNATKEGELSAWDWLAKQSKIELKAGVTVEDNTDFLDSDALYQVTFTYKTEEDLEAMNLIGSFQFWTVEDREAYLNGDRNIEYKSPYEYKEGMFMTSYDFMTWDEQPIEMYEIAEGTWSVTIPLPSGEYSYRYELYDGTTTEEGQLVKSSEVKDPVNLPPANMHSENDASIDCAWSLLYVGDSESCISGQEYIFPRNDGLTGTVIYDEYKSIDSSMQPMGVYLPYGYDENKTYKTLYLSHGSGGNEVEWMTIGSAKNIMDNLIADGEVDETIIITLDHDYFDLGNSDQNNGGFEIIKNNLMDYVIPFVEENYSVSKDARDRAFAGLSGGGRLSNYIYQTEAAKFGYFGMWSYVMYDEVIDPATAEYNDYPTLMLGYGNFDFGKSPYPEFIKYLEAAGLEYGLHEVDGAHNWETWRSLLSTFVKDYLWEDTDKVANPTDIVDNPDTSVTPDVDEIDSPSNESTVSVKTGDNVDMKGLLIISGISLLGISIQYYCKVRRRKVH